MKKWLTRRLMLVGVLGVLFVVFNMTATFGDSPPSSSFGSHATITVQNTSTTTDFKGIVPIEMQPQNLIQGGFVNAEMSDILFTDQNATEVGGVGQNITQNGQPFFWYGDIPKQNSKQVKLYTFNATPATHKFPLGGLLTDDITVADSASLSIPNNLTVEAEVTLKEAPSGTQEIAFKQNEYRVYLDNGVLKADLESTAMEEVWTTQNLLPDVSPTYNHQNPQNTQADGMIVQTGQGSYACETKYRTSSGWDTNWAPWDVSVMDNQYYYQGTFDHNAKYLLALNKELMGTLDGHYGIPTIPRKGVWADVINGIDIEGVYNHQGITVNQTNGFNAQCSDGCEMIHLKDDPNGYYTADNFRDHTIVYWEDIGRADWSSFGNHPWGYGIAGTNPWNDSDQQSQEWYDLHYPSYWTHPAGIQANGNTPFDGGGSYVNAAIHSSLWAGWEDTLANADPNDLPTYNGNPNYDMTNLGSYTDTLFQTALVPFDISNVTTHNAKDSWIAPHRGKVIPNYQGGNWYTCYVGYRHTDFDETGLQNIKILGVKNHLLYQTDNYSGYQTNYDYFYLNYGGDPESTTSMFGNWNYPPASLTGSKNLTGAGGFGGHYEGTIWHYGDSSTWTGPFTTFTHPTTDNAHPKFGQTMNTPWSYGWQDMYSHVGNQSAGLNTTIEDLNHWYTQLQWGSASSRIHVLNHWLEVRYFAEQSTSVNTTVTSSATLVKDTKYDVKLTFEKPDVKLWLNGVEVGTGTLNGDLTDSSSSLVIGESVNGWIDDVKISSGSVSIPVAVVDLRFEPSHNTNTQVGDVTNSWVYTGTVADQSGNSNTGTYNLTSDTTDITTVVGGLVVADEPPPSGTDGGVKNQVGLLPVDVFLTPQAIQESPITQGLHDASTVGTMPQDAWWLLLATIIATVAGAKLMNYLPSLTVVAVAGGVVFAFIILFAGLTLWFLAFYALWAMGTISIHQYWKA